MVASFRRIAAVGLAVLTLGVVTQPVYGLNAPKKAATGAPKAKGKGKAKAKGKSPPGQSAATSSTHPFAAATTAAGTDDDDAPKPSRCFPCLFCMCQCLRREPFSPAPGAIPHPDRPCLVEPERYPLACVFRGLRIASRAPARFEPRFYRGYVQGEDVIAEASEADIGSDGVVGHPKTEAAIKRTSKELTKGRNAASLKRMADYLWREEMS